MWTCNAIDPKTNNPCGASNPDDVDACAACGAPKPAVPPAGPVGPRWLVIVPVVVLVLSMLLTWGFSPAMRMNLHAALEGEGERHVGEGEILLGASSEEYRTVLSTDYSATFIPTRLEEMSGPMRAVQFFYGPLMLTGTPLEMPAVSEGGAGGLSGGVTLALAGVSGPAVFFLVFLVLLFVFDVFLRDPNSVPKLVIGFTLTWLVYSLIIWAFGELITSGIDELANRLLTEEQGPAKFAPSALNAFGPAVRVFLVGMVYWVVSFVVRRVRSEAPLARETQLE